ncbi:hypothetical protein [Acrocarpospora pleiomorpha]|nr:hypothetical protein [Acrocarpospora pleiomorpha]
MNGEDPSPPKSAAPTSPLFHTNMTPYGEIQLRTDRRLDLTDLPTP